MGELHQKKYYSSCEAAINMIGVILIIVGIFNLGIYAKRTYSEVQAEVRKMHLTGIKKIFTTIFFFIVEFLDDVNLIGFCGIPIVLGLILLGSK